MKRIIRDNFRVTVTGTVTLPPVPGAYEIRLPVSSVVYPRPLGDFSAFFMSDSLASRDIEGDYERRCNEIVAVLSEQQPRLKAEVVCDTAELCSHCGLNWEVFTQEDAERYPDWDDPIGLPQCCDAAQAEFHAAKQVTA